MTRLLVCGGRDFNDRARLFGKLDDLLIERGGFDVIIQGGAKGADTLARVWAIERGVPVQQYTADWDKYAKAAGPIRNQQMLEEGKPTLVVAFPGGRGTQDMITRSRRRRIEIIYG